LQNATRAEKVGERSGGYMVLAHFQQQLEAQLEFHTN